MLPDVWSVTELQCHWSSYGGTTGSQHPPWCVAGANGAGMCHKETPGWLVHYLPPNSRKHSALRVLSSHKPPFSIPKAHPVPSPQLAFSPWKKKAYQQRFAHNLANDSAVHSHTQRTLPWTWSHSTPILNLWTKPESRERKLRFLVCPRSLYMTGWSITSDTVSISFSSHGDQSLRQVFKYFSPCKCRANISMVRGLRKRWQPKARLRHEAAGTHFFYFSVLCPLH